MRPSRDIKVDTGSFRRLPPPPLLKYSKRDAGSTYSRDTHTLEMMMILEKERERERECVSDAHT